MWSPDRDELRDSVVMRADFLKVTPGCQPPHAVPDENDVALVRIGGAHSRDNGIQLLALLEKVQVLVIGEYHSVEIARLHPPGAFTILVPGMLGVLEELEVITWASAKCPA